MTNVTPFLPREDTLRAARAAAMAMHPATLNQPERQALATVTELRTRERR